MIQKEVMQENLTQKDITRKGGIPETEICGAIFDCIIGFHGSLE